MLVVQVCGLLEGVGEEWLDQGCFAEVELTELVWEENIKINQG